MNGNGFKIEYKAINFTCGGNFYNQSGILTSPLYPNQYPTADCVYLISQPNGTYVNISFLTMDIECNDNDVPPAQGTSMVGGDLFPVIPVAYQTKIVILSH